MAVKKIPMRMCCGCAEHFPKKELVRIVHTKDGEISLDPTGKKSGRGAYICRSPECLEKARKAKRLERAFECQIPAEVYEKLTEELRHSDE